MSIFTSSWFFLLLIIICVAAAWFLFIRPRLKSLHAVTGVALVANSPQFSAWERFTAWLQGARTVLVSLFISIISALSSSFDTVTSLSPSDLDPLKNADLWHAFLPEGTVLKIISFLGIAGAMLAISGHLRVAKIAPLPDTSKPGA